MLGMFGNLQMSTTERLASLLRAQGRPSLPFGQSCAPSRKFSPSINPEFQFIVIQASTAENTLTAHALVVGKLILLISLTYL